MIKNVNVGLLEFTWGIIIEEILFNLNIRTDRREQTL